MGPLQIKMTLSNLIGDWLENSGWVEILVKANIGTSGRAKSFLKSSHPKRLRYAYQVTCAELLMLMNEAYQKTNQNGDLNSWITTSKGKSVQFLYWSTVFKIEMMLLAFVKSLRISNYKMFLSCLEHVVPCMFAIDHIHFSRWLPVFINDLKLLPMKHASIYKEFLSGNFTMNKTEKSFSSIGID